MTVKTDGIVIREQTTGESDRLITLLTRQNGIIKAFVNGARRPGNKNASSTGLLCYSDFTFEKTKRDVYIVREATSKELFFKLRENISLLSLAQYFAELTYETAPREEPADEYLALLLNSLYLLCRQTKPEHLIKSVTELRMLCLAGYMPNILSCVCCGEYENEEMLFDCRTGELFCKECAGTKKLSRLSSGVLRAMRHICLSEENKIFSFTLSGEGLEALTQITERYLKNITMKKYKTLDFYKLMTQ